MAYDKINFGRAALLALPAATAGKRTYYGDIKEPGLLLCVTATGTKSFQVYLKIGGRPVRVTLGRFSPSLAESMELPKGCSHNEFLSNTPELNVRMARSLAALVKIDLKAGANPSDTKRVKRAEMTLGDLFEEYVNRHLIPSGKKSIDEMRQNFERYLGDINASPQKFGPARAKVPGSVNWQRRQLSAISKHDIQKLLTDLCRDSNKHAANRALELLRAMFYKAIDWGFFSKQNPAAGIKKYYVRSRERFLQSDELPRIFESLAQEVNSDIRDYVMLALLTGARKSNVLSMRWADVNLDRAEWRLPITKNGEALTLPLMPEAVEIIRSRKPNGPAEYVFPGSGASGHIRDAKSGWRRVLDRDEVAQLAQRIKSAGINFEWPLLKIKAPRDKSRKSETLEESLSRARKVASEMNIDTNGARINDIRIHDLRRTLGSWQAAGGASLLIIGKSLGQLDPASTMIYSRLNIDPVRDSMHTATRAMLIAGGLIQEAEIIAINKNQKIA